MLIILKHDKFLKQNGIVFTSTTIIIIYRKSGNRQSIVKYIYHYNNRKKKFHEPNRSHCIFIEQLTVLLYTYTV